MDINELGSILNRSFGWNKARMECFVCLLISLFKARTVNLTELACGFEKGTNIDSCYKRIKRFFREFNFCFTKLAAWILAFFELEQSPLYLSMDRTHWRWGKQDINVLMLSIVYKGIAIPIFWDLLPKRGNSNTPERIVLLQRFINHFGKQKIACLLADREFIGKEWFAWMNEQGIPFCIRIKKNSLTTNSRGQELSVARLFRHLQINEPTVLLDRRAMWDQKVYLSALRLSDGELLIVASNVVYDSPLELYGRRWEIETLFSCFKSRGFSFEETHMTKPERIAKLIALLAVGFCWAYKTGEWKDEQKPIKIKKHGRRAMSIFRYGLDIVRQFVLSPNRQAVDFITRLLEFLKIMPNCGVVG